MKYDKERRRRDGGKEAKLFHVTAKNYPSGAAQINAPAQHPIRKGLLTRHPHLALTDPPQSSRRREVPRRKRWEVRERPSAGAGSSRSSSLEVAGSPWGLPSEASSPRVFRAAPEARTGQWTAPAPQSRRGRLQHLRTVSEIRIIP